MIDIQAIRRANFLLLLAECGDGDVHARGAAAQLSRVTGVKPAHISQIKNRAAHASTGRERTIGSQVARQLETGMRKPHGWMDHQHRVEATERGQELAKLASILTPEQIEILISTASAFVRNNRPPDEPDFAVVPKAH